MILVLGGTGRLGREAVRLLAAGGAHKVRVLVRDASKAAATAGAGVEIVAGGMTDADSLARALTGVECVFVIPPNVRGQAEVEGRIYRAARRAAVGHVVKLSTVKADANSPCYFFKEHALAEERLKASGVGFTILRSNSFMQNLLWFAKEIKSKGGFSLPMGDAKTAPVDIRDVAAVASAVLTGRAPHGATYNISGPEKLSFAEIAQKLSAATGKRIEYRDIPPAEFLNMLIQSEMPRWRARAVTASWTVARRGEPVVTGAVLGLTKRPPVTFEQFARCYADNFVGDGL